MQENTQTTTYSVCLNDFIENDECKEREKLENKIYSYMFAKQVMPCTASDAMYH